MITVQVNGDILIDQNSYVEKLEVIGGKTSDEKETCSQIDLLTKRCNILLIFDRRKSFCFCFNSGSNSLFSLINI